MDYKRHRVLKRTIKILIAALVFVIISIFAFWQYYTSPDIDEQLDFVRVMDVGQGDSILIYSNGYSALLDTGTETSQITLYKNLKKQKIKTIDLLLETHMHIDHTGGLNAVVDKFKIKNIILPDLVENTEGYPASVKAKEAVMNASGGVYTAEAGQHAQIGEFEITVLGYYKNLNDENNRSVIYMAKIGEKKFLFMADCEEPAEQLLMEDNINFDCDVLKVGHHGSKTSTSDRFLNIATPDFAAISVGEGNQYSHPDNGTVQKLINFGTEVYRTDTNGDITFYYNNGEITVTTQK